MMDSRQKKMETCREYGQTLADEGTDLFEETWEPAGVSCVKGCGLTSGVVNSRKNPGVAPAPPRVGRVERV
jgi:hypothetical protein